MLNAGTFDLPHFNVTLDSFSASCNATFPINGALYNIVLKVSLDGPQKLHILPRLLKILQVKIFIAKM